MSARLPGPSLTRVYRLEATPGEPLGEALEAVYANIIKHGSLPPPVDWHPAEG